MVKITFGSKIDEAHKLIPVFLSGDYNASVNDVVKIVVGFPIYPTVIVTNLIVEVTGDNIIKSCSIVNDPPINVLGSGAIGAFINFFSAGKIQVKVSPIDTNHNIIENRIFNLSLTVS